MGEVRAEVAREMVRRAAECDVDAVKFQTLRAEQLVSRSEAQRFGRLKSFELSRSEFEGLSRQTRELGMLFISTPLDLQSADFLEPLLKVP